MDSLAHLNLRDFQLQLVDMLADFDLFCKNHGIRYFLVGGSTLGAIRHNGFIPWDDDIDLGMMRDEFERFERLVQNEYNGHIGERLLYENVEGHSFPNAPTGYLYDISNPEIPLQACGTIDIFPIDHAPITKRAQFIQNLYSKIYHLCILRQPAQNRGKLAKIVTAVAIHCLSDKIWKYLQWKSKKMITKWNNEETGLVCNIFGMQGYKREIMPASYIGNLVEHEFENKKYPVPEKYDPYLKHVYGEYWKWPPEEDRKPKHKDL